MHGNPAVKDFVSHGWRQLLDANGLNSFVSVWGLDIGWFEEPNRRRGGWSGVSRCELDLPEGGTVGIFVKRQEDHVCRTPLHPLRGVLTFEREFHNLQRYRSFNIPTLEPVYFASRKVNGHRRAILITQELAGYESLDRRAGNLQSLGRTQRLVRRELIGQVARAASVLHHHHLQHNCFYPKHLLVGDVDGAVDIRIIDLEKTKWRLRKERAMLRDLDTLNRHSPDWSRSERLRFLLDYFQVSRVDTHVRATWNRLAARMRSKQRRRT